MIKSVLILAIFASVAFSKAEYKGAPNYCEDVTDPNINVAADPDDCHCFYDCADQWVQGHHCCPPPLAFNPDPEVLNCDFPSQIPNCDNIKDDPNVCEDAEFDVIADPEDCHCFYDCSNGEVQGHQCCPPPLAFNPEISNCDFPDHVDGCEKKITKDVNPCEGVTDPNQSTAADPEDCHCFYDCAGQVAMEHHCCADGLAFDPVLLVCDWEANIENCP